MLKYQNIKKIHIELSSACNAACPVCPRNIMGGPVTPGLKIATISFTEFVQMFPASFILQLDQILFCGRHGDPVMCRDLPEIMKYINSHNPDVRVTMHTNGGIRSAEWWAELAQTHSNLLTIFSVDGLEDTNHLYRRGVVWHRVERNMRSYIQAGGEICWEYLIFKHNEHQLDDARALAADIGVQEIKFKRPYGFSTINEDNPRLDIYDQNMKFEYSIRSATEERHQNTFWKDQEKTDWRDLEIDCHAVRQREIYVDAQGYVHPCCWLAYASQPDMKNDEHVNDFQTWLLENVSLDRIDAHLHTIEEIVNSGYMDEIAATWNTRNKFYTCAEMCARKTNMRQKLIVKDD